MPCHHRGCGKAIRHARAELVDTIPACRVAEDIHAIWVHIFQHDEILDEPVEEFIDVLLMPKVPGIRRCSWRDVNAFAWLVAFAQLNLIAPLRVIYGRRGAASAVHRYEKTAAIRGGRIRKTQPVEFHFQITE